MASEVAPLTPPARDRVVRSPFGRRILALGVDLALFLAVLFGLALLPGFPGSTASVPRPSLLVLAGTAVPLLGLALWYSRSYWNPWRYVSIPDLLRIVAGTGGGWLLTLVILAANGTLLHLAPAILVLAPILFCTVAATARVLVRLVYDRSLDFQGAGRVPVLVVGAGRGGELLLRELRNQHHYRVIGLVDDDPVKRDRMVQGVRVLGAIDDLPRLIVERGAEMVIVAIPSVTATVLDRVVTYCAQKRVPVRRLPLLPELRETAPPVTTLRPIEVQDLLRRAPLSFDEHEVTALLRGRRILVTGGAGSIGTELLRQILRHDPAQLLVIDHDEEALYRLGQHPGLNAASGVSPVPVLASILDRVALRKLFTEHAPEFVFHAAAYKHVPLAEDNVRSVIRNNVLGTSILLEEAIRGGVERFLLVSTDKTVHPRGVMGASKRAAELLLLARPPGSLRVVITRFGNVLDSSGSVVPLFRRQIFEGGPVTVTDPEASRYFMLIDEAVSLILQAAVLGGDGEIFVLDMGAPYRINDLAERMIRLAGREPHVDIPIIYTGLRPGEKIREDLAYEDEELRPTLAPHILQAQPPAFDRDAITQGFAELFAALDCETISDGEILKRLHRLVPQYRLPAEQPATLRVLPGGQAHTPSSNTSQSSRP